MFGSLRFLFVVCLLFSGGFASSAAAFCGFYVAKADAKLWNRASRVVLVRDGERTVLTMANDYEGEPSEFAMVVPVPVVLEREQIHVGESAVIEHLDAFTAPRLVEYFDPDPCARRFAQELADGGRLRYSVQPATEKRAKALGVTIEASYTVGEYDILILSARQSDGLVTWLRENDYRVPDAAGKIVGSYLKQGLKFFVAKVNLEEQARIGATQLRPLQMAFETPRFGLPIRLGTVNADGSQDLFVYTLSRKGRVETTNYPTVKIPSGDEIPTYVKERFADFYRAMFDTQSARQGGSGVFLEYAWNMAWCDPCAAEPLSRDELQQLGVFWLKGPSRPRPQPGRFAPPQQAPVDVFVTRLHVRYDAESFPEDLRFQATGDTANFQGRYVLRHPWTGAAQCEAATAYQAQLAERLEGEAQTLANLTSWDIAEIRRQLEIPAAATTPAKADPWWRRLWPED